ncbi:MAG: extracellular solute-binding protein [Clostridia bacterium]|nr:extracellular solute-binding protein [Clostridia bacterium]MBQ9994904.1 extracellular solute-binding protein [Clostridia bacterium]
MKRNLILALVAAMLLPTFAGCSDAPAAENGGSNAVSASDGTAETVAEEPEADKYDLAKEKFEAIAAADFAGADFGIASQAATGNSEKEIWVEELTGDAVNDAVYNRNLTVNDRFNCNITLTPGDVNSIVRQAVQAGDGTYKLAFPNMATAASMAQVGLLMDYNKLENLNLTESWWDQGTLAMEIADKVFFMNGDINYLDNDVTYIQLFNKQLITDVGLDVPYELVREGKWTIDQFREMCMNVTTDLDGDGAYTDKDRYGYVTTGEGPCTFFYGSGLSLISYDDAGVPVLNVDMEKTVSALEKVVKIISEDNITRIPSDVAVGKTMFMEDRVLFYGEVLSYVVNIREMETAFGVLPIPKYDELQEDYYTYCNAISSTATVPKTSEDLGMITSVLEGMAIQSFIQVTPAYYDIALSRKYTRDDESAEMLDIALANRVYDIGRIYSLGGIGSIFQTLAASGSTDFASSLASKEKAAKKTLERVVKDFTELE